MVLVVRMVIVGVCWMWGRFCLRVGEWVVECLGLIFLLCWVLILVLL